MIWASVLLTMAAGGSPYKLIVVANDSTAAIDYPSKERCEIAARAAEDEARKRLKASTQNGDPIVRPALRVIAFCIPG